MKNIIISKYFGVGGQGWVSIKIPQLGGCMSWNTTATDEELIEDLQIYNAKLVVNNLRILESLFKMRDEHGVHIAEMANRVIENIINF